VGQARAIVIAGGRKEHLCLVLEPAERLGVDDAIAIALERGADCILFFLAQAAPGICALGGLWRQDLPLARLELLANGCRRLHDCPAMAGRKL
jgi:hypothetical protein